MLKTAVVTDSNSGITQSQAKDLGIFVLPMPFLIDGEQFYEDVTLTQSDFYKKLASPVSISTSQPIVGELLEFWNDILQEYDELVYIPMSSGLSKSCDTAKILAKDYDGKIQVVDNQRISVTLKQSVFDALKLREKGYSATEIKQYLENTKMDSSIYISLSTLKYLRKGGRITPAAATVGTILHLRPVLQIQGALLDKYCMKSVTLKQAKAAMIAGIEHDLNTRFKEYVEKGEMVLAVAHTQNLERAELFKEELEAIFNLPVVYNDPLSLSVSCHIGPGALAVVCMRVVK